MACQRQEPQESSDGGHDDGAQPDSACSMTASRMGMPASRLAGSVYEHNGVIDDNADQHDNAHEGGKI
jgi:hypothetical protein